MCLRDGRLTVPTALLIIATGGCFLAAGLLTYAVFSASFRILDDGRHLHSFGLIRYCKVSQLTESAVQCYSREMQKPGIEPAAKHLIIAQSELMVLVALVLAMHMGLLASVASLLAFCSKMCARLSRILMLMAGACTFLGAMLFVHVATSLNEANFGGKSSKVEARFGPAFAWCLLAGSAFLLSLLISLVSTLADDETDLLQIPLSRAGTISEFPRKISRRMNAIRRPSQAHVEHHRPEETTLLPQDV
ncbi:unnamed protein product, partial [Mesorhabditis spiculigera]